MAWDSGNKPFARVIIETSGITNPDPCWQTAQQIERISARLDQLAPAATKVTAAQGAVDPNSLLNFPKKFRRLRENELPNLPDHGFSSITLQLEAPIDWERLQAALIYLTEHYKQLVRLKGLVSTPGQNQPLLIQGLAGKLYPPSRLPSSQSDDGIGRLVFISSSEIKGITEALMTRLRIV